MASRRKSSRRPGGVAAQTVPASVVEPVTADVPAIATPTAPESPAAAAAGTARPVSVLELGSSLSIQEVTEYATQFKGLLAAGPTDIDASKLESIDTAGIQLLLVAAAAARDRGYKMKLCGAQGIMTGAGHSLGLDEYLGELAEISS